MSEVRYIPHSARIVCAACDTHYDYRDTEDRECPTCSCPPPTVRVHHDYGNGAGRGEIAPNPAHAEFLRAHGKPTPTDNPPANTPSPVSTKPANSQPPVSTDGKPDRKAYMRELMRSKRAAAKLARGKPA